jgi:hypothetical protein
VLRGRRLGLNRRDEFDLASGASVAREANQPHIPTSIAGTVRRASGWTGKMPGNPREMITVAPAGFPVRIRIGVPPEGLSSAIGK